VDPESVRPRSYTVDSDGVSFRAQLEIDSQVMKERFPRLITLEVRDGQSQGSTATTGPPLHFPPQPLHIMLPVEVDVERQVATLAEQTQVTQLATFGLTAAGVAVVRMTLLPVSGCTYGSATRSRVTGLPSQRFCARRWMRPSRRGWHAVRDSSSPSGCGGVRRSQGC